MPGGGGGGAAVASIIDAQHKVGTEVQADGLTEVVADLQATHRWITRGIGESVGILVLSDASVRCSQNPL